MTYLGDWTKMTQLTKELLTEIVTPIVIGAWIYVIVFDEGYWRMLINATN